MTCDTCGVDHMVRNPGGFHLCILKAIKNWTWEEARLNLPLPTVAMTTSLILIGHYQIAIYSGWFVQSVYKVVTCLSVVRIEQTLVGGVWARDYTVGGFFKVCTRWSHVSVVRIEQTLVAAVDQCTCASGIVTVDS